MIRQSDREFLVSLGIAPFDVERVHRQVQEKVRTRVLRGVAILQFAAIVGGIIWTSV